MRRPAAQIGFTTVELVVTLIIIGLLAAVAGPRFFDLDVFHARGFYDEVLSALRYAQRTAIAQRRVVYVRLDTTSVSACYANTFPCTAPADQVPGPYGEKPFSVNAGSGVSLAPVTTLFFDALGRPHNGTDPVPTSQINTSTFTANLTISLTGGGDTRTVTVERETGYVR